ncbi:MAG: zinc-dependent metalloprotease [Bdellovibrio sp.]
MNFSKHIYSLLSLSLLLSACTKETTIIEKQAPESIRESFTAGQGEGCDKVSCITLQKASLGKIFLLITSGKTSGSTPQWYDLKPLVVSFEKSGNKVAILGENYNSIYKEIRTVNLIQTFDVVKEDDKTVTFNWGSGLKTLVAQSPIDIDGPLGDATSLTESSFASLTITDSFIRDVKFNEKSIELEQISKTRSGHLQAESEKNIVLQEKEDTIALNIQIRAYNLSSEFKAKPFDTSRRVGFFVNKVSKPENSEAVVNLISKWDLSDSKGPIVARISSSVPADYLQAVQEGVLYWNKVLGKEVLQLEVNVDPQSSPQDRSIFVHWIPWLDSGAAYAKPVSDPLSGEILRAQVFMPSVFTRVGSANLVRANNDVPVAVGAVACDLTASLKKIQVLSQEASGSQRLRLAQDMVRSTVAHEFGHALGLRHNFAGSFSAKVSTQEIAESFKTYTKTPDHSGLPASTSIMDYLSGMDDILVSAYIRKAPLTYDTMAMKWAYSEGASDHLDEAVSKYCSDEDIAIAATQGLKIYGCQRFDEGNNPLHREYLNAQMERQEFVKVLFASILGRLYPGDKPEVKEDLKKVLAETNKWSRLSVENISTAGSMLMGGVIKAEWSSLESAKAGDLMSSKFGVDSAFSRERQRSLAEIGGYGVLLNKLWRDQDNQIVTDWLPRQIEELKNSTYFQSGMTLANRPYSLSSEEQGQILQFFNKQVEQNKKVLASGLLALAPRKNTKAATETSDALVLPYGLMTENDADALVDLYMDLLRASDGSKVLKVGKNLESSVVVALPFLSTSERTQWASLMSGYGLNFYMDARRELVKRFQLSKINEFLKAVDSSLDLSTDLQPGKLPSYLKEKGLLESDGAAWLENEIEIFETLKKDPGLN